MDHSKKLDHWGKLFTKGLGETKWILVVSNLKKVLLGSCVVVAFFSLLLETPSLGSIHPCHLCGWWLCSLSIGSTSRGRFHLPHQTSTPREGPLKCGALSDKWFVYLHPYIYIHIYRVCGWVRSIIFPCTPPLRCRLVDSGEAKSFRSIKQTSTRKYSTKDPWRMIEAIFVSWDFPWTPKMDALEWSFLSST